MSASSSRAEAIPRPSKKPKVEAESKSPITFSVPQGPIKEPDTRLKVFDQEFHVHSAVLRVESTFFRAFYDADDATPSPQGRGSGDFKYEWVTIIDDDGQGWSLVHDDGNVSDWNLVDIVCVPLTDEL